MACDVYDMTHLSQQGPIEIELPLCYEEEPLRSFAVFLGVLCGRVRCLVVPFNFRYIPEFYFRSRWALLPTSSFYLKLSLSDNSYLTVNSFRGHFLNSDRTY